MLVDHGKCVLEFLWLRCVLTSIDNLVICFDSFSIAKDPQSWYFSWKRTGMDCLKLAFLWFLSFLLISSHFKSLKRHTQTLAPCSFFWCKTSLLSVGRAFTSTSPNGGMLLMHWSSWPLRYLMLYGFQQCGNQGINGSHKTLHSSLQRSFFKRHHYVFLSLDTYPPGWWSNNSEFFFRVLA